MKLATLWNTYNKVQLNSKYCLERLCAGLWLGAHREWGDRLYRRNRQCDSLERKINKRIASADTIDAWLLELSKICPVRLDDEEWETPPIGIVSNAIYGYQSDIRELRKQKAQLAELCEKASHVLEHQCSYDGSYEGDRGTLYDVKVRQLLLDARDLWQKP